MVKSFDTTREIVTLVRNPKSWGKTPYRDSLVYETSSNPMQQPAALKNAEVDMIYPQPLLDLVNQVKALAPAVTSQVSFGLSFEHLDMNTQHQFLSDINVRLAIAYGIDRGAIVKAGPAQLDPRAPGLNTPAGRNNRPRYTCNPQ